MIKPYTQTPGALPVHVVAMIMAALVLTLVIATGDIARAQSPVRAASVDGKSIAVEEIDASIISQLLPLQQQIYALRKAALENLVTRAVLEREARRRGITVEELGRQLTAGSVEVPQSQVEQLYLEHAATFAAMSSDEAKERIRLDLESQARMKNYRDALARLRQSSAIEIYLDEPRLPAVAARDAAFTLGREGAPVTITEFADFQCPYCRGVETTLKQVLRDYGDRVRFVFKYLPLDIHAQALASAAAAFCAGRQGSFWPYHDALFAAEDLAPETLRSLAAKLKLSLAEFDACSGSEATRAAIMDDAREASRLGISGTPTFVVNGRLVRGAISLEDFKHLVEQELKSAQSTSPIR